ncbi:MAG TPA: AlpA family transcriptional regulator [Sphingomicrobium sp.]|nr:AlpA family transcriptional regulator [Sphingomicrobium sp.]
MPEPNQPVEFINIKDVVQLTSLSKPVLYRMMRRGEFPRQVSLSPRRVAWVLSEVDEWQRVRTAKREQAAEAA